MSVVISMHVECLRIRGTTLANLHHHQPQTYTTLANLHMPRAVTTENEQCISMQLCMSAERHLVCIRTVAWSVSERAKRPSARRRSQPGTRLANVRATRPKPGLGHIGLWQSSALVTGYPLRTRMSCSAARHTSCACNRPCWWHDGVTEQAGTASERGMQMDFSAAEGCAQSQCCCNAPAACPCMPDSVAQAKPLLYAKKMLGRELLRSIRPRQRRLK